MVEVIISGFTVYQHLRLPLCCYFLHSCEHGYVDRVLFTVLYCELDTFSCSSEADVGVTMMVYFSVPLLADQERVIEALVAVNWL